MNNINLKLKGGLLSWGSQHTGEQKGVPYIVHTVYWTSTCICRSTFVYYISVHVLQGCIVYSVHILNRRYRNMFNKCVGTYLGGGGGEGGSYSTKKGGGDVFV